MTSRRELQEKSDAYARTNSPVPISASELNELLADARALWAVRVLDAKLALMPAETAWETNRGGSGAHYVDFTDGMRDTLDGPWDGCMGATPDAARLAAAEAVFPTLPADVRAELGERP
jgi:hypothetical protein